MISTAPLERLLVEKEMNLTLLSQVTGIEISTLEKMKKGGSITKTNIEAICRVFQCQPCDIIEFKKTEEKGHWEYIENKED